MPDAKEIAVTVAIVLVTLWAANNIGMVGSLVGQK